MIRAHQVYVSHACGDAFAVRFEVRDIEHPPRFDTRRFHAFFTTSILDTVTADKTHRAHAIIEQVNADLKNSALAHLPSGVFTASAA